MSYHAQVAMMMSVVGGIYAAQDKQRSARALLRAYQAFLETLRERKDCDP